MTQEEFITELRELLEPHEIEIIAVYFDSLTFVSSNEKKQTVSIHYKFGSEALEIFREKIETTTITESLNLSDILDEFVKHIEIKNKIKIDK